MTINHLSATSTALPHSAPERRAKTADVLVLTVLAVLGIGLLTFNLLWLGFVPHQRVTYYFWFFNAQVLIYLAACGLVIKYEPNRFALVLVLLVAAVLRGLLLPTEPAHSTDIFRYVWEGYVQTKGVNPYRYVPAAPELAHLRDNYVYDNINRKDYARSPYPPVAQVIFATGALIRPLGVTTLKVILVGFECITVAALLRLLLKLGMNPARVIVYAWNPLAVWEVSQNGHIDAAAVTFIVLAALAASYRKRTLVGALVACAALVKLFPAMLAVAFYQRWDKRLPLGMAVTLAAFCVPYFLLGQVTLGHLAKYPAEEGFISGERFILLKWIHRLAPMHPFVYLGIFALLLGAAGLWLLFRREKDIFAQLRGCTLLAGLVLFFISPQYGWYYLWLLPLLSVTLERVTLAQAAATLAVAFGFVRYHFAQRLTPDLLVAPVTAGLALMQYPSVQWLWLLLVASAAWLSWI